MTFPSVGQDFKEARLFGQYVTRKQVEFATGTTGAVGNHDIFTVTGAAHVVVVAYCTEDLAGATATISVGTDGVVAGLIPLTTATNIDTGMVWFGDNAPSECEAIASMGGAFLCDNISYDILTAPIDDGTLTFTCFWTPLIPTASIVPV